MELGRARERRKIQDEMRALALNVFLQGRRLLNHNSTVKSLTGFGTAAAADLFLKSKDVRFHCVLDQLLATRSQIQVLFVRCNIGVKLQRYR